MTGFYRPKAAAAALRPACALGLALAAAAPVWGADATLVLEGGAFEQDGQSTRGAGFAEARLRGPIDAPVVFQLEARIGAARGDAIGGGALRAWAPLGNRARLGAYVAVADREGGYDELGQAGFELELYFQRALLHLDIGYQDGDPEDDHGLVGLEGIVGLTDDLTFGLGGDFISGDDDIALATLAWRPAPFAMPGFTVFAHGEYEVSDTNFAALYLGGAWDLGADAATPLIARRRQVGAPGRLARTMRAYLNDPA